ncbi:hypothetical protein DH2020_045087 [Rehmannia glutinosa]|uniref:Magnesium transporter n=1 Tax=Rehmannia glutinosa TaxID=99300 RepID=A0ABR0UGR0_REHGL
MGKLTFRRRKKAVPPPMPPPPPAIEASTTSKTTVKKKAGGARLWMRMDRLGQSELIECDKSVIIKRVSIPARDLRILGPIFSHSSSILAREKAMIVNLEFIRAIVTAEEVLLLDPLRQEVLPFVDQLRRQLPQKSPSKCVADQMASQDNELQSPTAGQWLPVPEAAEGVQDELPFEFQVLEMALEVVCTYLDSNVAELERDAYPALDELAISVSTKNLEHVRSLKSNLTRLLARVQKVISARLSSTRSGSLVSNYLNDDDVEDLEMLLEAYFMQLDGTRNKILSVREYIDDTEDYVNIQLDNQRNELIQLQLTMTIASFAIAVETLLAGIFGMNIPCTLYKTEGIFGNVVWIMTAACVVLFILVLAYARWKKLLGS